MRVETLAEKLAPDLGLTPERTSSLETLMRYRRSPSFFRQFTDARLAADEGGTRVDGVDASALTRVCAEADKSKDLEKRVRYLAYVLAHVLVSADNAKALDEARDWVRVNHPHVMEPS